MREQVAAARGFVAQGLAQPVALDGDEEQVVLPGEVAGGGLGHLRGGGEMDEPVRDIHRRAGEAAQRSASRHRARGQIL